MEFDALTYLRWHVEAVWGVALPAEFGKQSEIELLPTDKRPPWKLLLADIAVGRFRIWRPDTPLSERAILLSQLESVFALPSEAAVAPEISREVALRLAASPEIEEAQARNMTRLLTLEDQSLIETFEHDSSEYYLRPEARPLVGVVIDKRLLTLAHSSRRTPEACELGIDTLPDARRKGYALAATVVWAREVQRAGLVPLYSAFAENTASLALAEKAGYREFARTANIR
jgi:RimJ/RimL family protein N-acetyltransferase